MTYSNIYAFLISILFISNTSASLIKNSEIPDISNDELIALSLSNMVLYDDEPWMPIESGIVV